MTRSRLDRMEPMRLMATTVYSPLVSAATLRLQPHTAQL